MIEASAGTGKTFSVAVLVLRLLVEREVPIGKILMMTFTNAAVAELSDRIRLFIRQGHDCLQDPDHANQAMRRILVDGKSEDQMAHARKLLQKAMLELDQVSVLTIHSFCSRMLSRFAFETGQSMNTEPIGNIKELAALLVDDFWRTNVATLPSQMLKALMTKVKFSRETLLGAITESVEGKEYAYMVEGARCQNLEFVEFSTRDAIRDNRDSCRAIFSLKGQRIPKSYMEKLEQDDFDGIIEDFLKARAKKSKYTESFTDLAEWIDRPTRELQLLVKKINSHAISEIVPSINRLMEERSLITYNQMVERMKSALNEANGQLLKSVMRDEYKAVFIDEFQDTDTSQFEVFRQSFIEDHASHNTVVFLIGDPKQMIYAWRKADMTTYLKARELVGEGEVYHMKENFRSSERMIRSMNLFFKKHDSFDTFLMGGMVEYIDVEYPQFPKTRGELVRIPEQNAEVPIEIMVHDNKVDRRKRMMGQLMELIGHESNLVIPDEDNPGGYRRIRCSDIGILVRKNNEAAEVKRLLTRFGIPAVQIDESSIFNSWEAKQLLYILEAFLSRTPDNIRRAMNGPITRLNFDKLNRLDLDQITEDFRQCHDLLASEGVFNAVNRFLVLFGIRHLLAFEAELDGERSYANLVQLMEILHEAETDLRFSPDDLVSWLRNRLSDADSNKSDFEQRIESDEDAVRIVTIHKSKGLEYNVVFAPYLSLSSSDKHTYGSYRKDGGYFFAENEFMEPWQKGLSQMEADQENRRLMYVAVTRSKYKAFLHYNKSDASEPKSVIGQFIRNVINQFTAGNTSIGIKNPGQALVWEGTAPLVSVHQFDNDETKALMYPSEDRFMHLRGNQTRPITRIFDGHPPFDNWRRLSYSSIKSSASEKGTPRERVEHDEGLENFIFNEFPKGAKAGSILHLILERIDFTETDPEKWMPVISEALDFYRLKGGRERQVTRILEWIGHLLSVDLTVGGETFKLNQVGPQDLIPEFEFDFRLGEFEVGTLATAAGDIPVKVNQGMGTLRGIMNGKMDLFFRKNGKYYILDWKSNHLGGTLEDYGSEQVRTAMEESNFNLQYLIYTVAARKYLATRIPTFDYERDFGGVIYLFMRGVRREGNTGLFFEKVPTDVLHRVDGIFSESVV